MVFSTLIYSIFIGISCALVVPEGNLCINCKFFMKPLFNDMEMDYGRCKKFRITKHTNKVLCEKDFVFCSTARMFKEMCGRDGKLFQQKQSIKK